MSLLKAGVVGVEGKMGLAILSLLIKSNEFKVVGATELSGSTAIGKDIGALTASAEQGTKVKEKIEDAFKIDAAKGLFSSIASS